PVAASRSRSLPPCTRPPDRRAPPPTPSAHPPQPRPLPRHLLARARRSPYPAAAASSRPPVSQVRRRLAPSPPPPPPPRAWPLEFWDRRRPAPPRVRPPGSCGGLRHYAVQTPG
ncbi:Os03g0824350, partial [Oryza sativa Japonica Group]